jgi:hypothetical protein
MDQKTMLEAIKRKRLDMNDSEWGDRIEDEKSGVVAGKEPELAPHSAKGSSEGHQDVDTRDEDHQNINAIGERKGFGDKSAPHQDVKDLAQNRKKDIHDPANILLGKMVSGDGNYPQKDEMNVDLHKMPEEQASKTSKSNFDRGNAETQTVKQVINSKMGIKAKNARRDDDSEDNAGKNDVQKPFMGADLRSQQDNSSSYNHPGGDQDKKGGNYDNDEDFRGGNEEDGQAPERAPRKKLSGLKSARAALEAFSNK